jgi:2-C-methyl-D-erythritol 2,4-cyclodiphosphate synthase
MQNLPEFRIGEGHDLHRTIAGRPLILGGVTVDSDFGLDGHSDADVLLHAVIDALLGASANGDIGTRFPNTDEQWKGADSGVLLQDVVRLIHGQQWRINNLDCTISAEKPRLEPWKALIRDRLAELLQIETDRVNVKAKSGEKVGPIGESRAIGADAVVLLYRDQPTTNQRGGTD